MNRFRCWVILLTMHLLFFACPAMALDTLQSEVEDVPTTQDIGESIAHLSRQGKHFDALSKYYGQPDNEYNLSDRLAAVRSAWALGLIDRAREISDKVFSVNAYSGSEVSRLQLSRSIMELQERSLEQARAFAELGAQDLESSDLRSQFWLVIAESLKAQGNYSQAEPYYQRATREGNSAIRTEAQFLLGETQLKLGLLNDARYSFTAIPTDSPFASTAIRRLVEIDYKHRDYESVLTWYAEGKQLYPSEFEDPRLDYLRIVALSETGQVDEAKIALEKLRTHYSTKNIWATLAEGVVLSKELQTVFPRARLKSPVE